MKINPKIIGQMKDFDFDDDLSRMIERYQPSELSLDELDGVFAARNQPEYAKFLEYENTEDE